MISYDQQDMTKQYCLWVCLRLGDNSKKCNFNLEASGKIRTNLWDFTSFFVFFLMGFKPPKQKVKKLWILIPFIKHLFEIMNPKQPKGSKRFSGWGSFPVREWS